MHTLPEGIPRCLRAPSGRKLTQGLFYEEPHAECPPTYTLREYDFERDGVKYYSLRKIYLACMDPTETLFIDLCFDGDRTTWQRIIDSKVLKIDIDEWREELRTRLKSKGIQELQKIANDPDNKSRAAAARWLAEGKWEGTRRVGRPEKPKQQRQDGEYETDAQRMAEVMTLVKGDK